MKAFNSTDGNGCPTLGSGVNVEISDFAEGPDPSVGQRPLIDDVYEHFNYRL